MSDSDETVCNESQNDEEDAEIEEENSPSILTNWYHTETLVEKEVKSIGTPKKDDSEDNRKNFLEINVTDFSRGSLSPEFPLISRELKRKDSLTESNDSSPRGSAKISKAEAELLVPAQEKRNTENRTKDITDSTHSSHSASQEDEIYETEVNLVNLEEMIARMETEKDTGRNTLLNSSRFQNIKSTLTNVQKTLVEANHRNQVERKKLLSSHASNHQLNNEGKQAILGLAAKQRHLLEVFKKYKGLVQRLKLLKEHGDEVLEENHTKYQEISTSNARSSEDPSAKYVVETPSHKRLGQEQLLRSDTRFKTVSTRKSVQQAGHSGAANTLTVPATSSEYIEETFSRSEIPRYQRVSRPSGSSTYTRDTIENQPRGHTTNHTRNHTNTEKSTSPTTHNTMDHTTKDTSHTTKPKSRVTSEHITKTLCADTAGFSGTSPSDVPSSQTLLPMTSQTQSSGPKHTVTGTQSAVANSKSNTVAIVHCGSTNSSVGPRPEAKLTAPVRTSEYVSDASQNRRMAQFTGNGVTSQPTTNQSVVTPVSMETYMNGSLPVQSPSRRIAHACSQATMVIHTPSNPTTTTSVTNTTVSRRLTRSTREGCTQPPSSRRLPQTNPSSVTREQYCETANVMEGSQSSQSTISIVQSTAKGTLGIPSENIQSVRTSSSLATIGQCDTTNVMGSSQPVPSASSVGPSTMKPTLPMPLSLETLVKKRVLISGKNVLTAKSEGKLYSASLSEKGTIISAGGEGFTSPRSWVKAILGSKRKVKNDVAWKMVSYKDEPLIHYAAAAVTEQQKQTESLQNPDPVINMTSDPICRENPESNLINSKAALTTLLKNCRVTKIAKEELVPSEQVLVKDFWERADFELALLSKEILSGLDFR